MKSNAVISLCAQVESLF